MRAAGAALAGSATECGLDIFARPLLLPRREERQELYANTGEAGGLLYPHLHVWLSFRHFIAAPMHPTSQDASNARNVRAPHTLVLLVLVGVAIDLLVCLLYTSPSPRD